MKEVAKKESAALAVPKELQGSWGAEGISNADILIPRILLMQGLSEAVSDGAAAAGDLLRSTTKKVLARKGEAIDFIPLMSFKTWITSEKVGEKFEYRDESPMNSANEHLPLEYTERNAAGLSAHWRRDKSINLYVLLATDIIRQKRAEEAMAKGEMPSAEDALMPCLIAFRRTGYRTGREMLTYFKSCEQFRAPPASGVYRLTSFLEKGDKGAYHVMKCEQVGRSSVEQLTVAKAWYDVLHSAKVAVDAEVEIAVEPATDVPF